MRIILSPAKKMQHDENGPVYRDLPVFLSDPELKVIQAYDVWKEKMNYGKVSMGVVRSTYLIDEEGKIVKSFDKVKAADNPEQMLGELS